MDTFLPPIEKPKGLIMKLAYYFTRQQFGKVITPLKVHSARLPSAFGLFYTKIPKLDKKLLLPREISLLIRERVASINVCLFCMDGNRWNAIRESLNKAAACLCMPTGAHSAQASLLSISGMCLIEAITKIADGAWKSAVGKRGLNVSSAKRHLL